MLRSGYWVGVVVTRKIGLRCWPMQKHADWRKKMLFFKALWDGFLIRAEGQAVTNVSALSSCNDFKQKTKALPFFFCYSSHLRRLVGELSFSRSLSFSCTFWCSRSCVLTCLQQNAGHPPRAAATAGHFTARLQVHSSPACLISWLSPSRALNLC